MYCTLKIKIIPFTAINYIVIFLEQQTVKYCQEQDFFMKEQAIRYMSIIAFRTHSIVFESHWILDFIFDIFFKVLRQRQGNGTFFKRVTIFFSNYSH